MQIIKNEIHIGIENPFTFLHMTDTHLTLVDERDNERKAELAKSRRQWFSPAEEVLAEASAYAKEKGYTICHTGDLLDFVSFQNIDRAKSFCQENDVFMAAGNHEFSQYVGEAWEDAAYRNQSLSKVQAAFQNDIRFSCREINGVNLVAIDNGYYLFEQVQLDALKDVAKQKKPMILFMHTPLYTESLYNFSKARGGDAVYLMATPEEKMDWYSGHRFRQQRADAVTKDAYDYIMAEPLIKALITGHLHVNYEERLASGAQQIVTSCTDIREIAVG